MIVHKSLPNILLTVIKPILCHTVSLSLSHSRVRSCLALLYVSQIQVKLFKIIGQAHFQAVYSLCNLRVEQAT